MITERNCPQHGKQPNQKLKPYIVLQYLLRYTDEDHAASADTIAAYLDEDCGISAERRSIYRDIAEINRVMVMLEQKCTIEEAGEMLEEDDDLKWVVYDARQRGFYVRQREYDLNDIRLLAESVYASSFLSQTQSDRLVDVLCHFVSKKQSERIKHDILLTDRVKTDNKRVVEFIALINDAMRVGNIDHPHEPEKISFKYVHHAIAEERKAVENRHGEKYVVSPYKLLINNGYYYLLAYEDKRKKMITYRLDRMKDVSLSGVPRDGQEVFDRLDMHSYIQRNFSMFSGEERLVRIRFINPMLDTAVDRFGTKGVQYSTDDKRHFIVSAKVAISPQFYGWLLGFGIRAKLLYPDDVVADFKAYVDRVQKMYES